MYCVVLQHSKRVVQLVFVFAHKLFHYFLQVYLVVVLLVTFDLLTSVHSQGMFQTIALVKSCIIQCAN